MRLLALLLAAAALPLVLVVGLLAGLTIGLASWAADEAPHPPADLVPLYREAGHATGVPWAAIAAIDGAEYAFALPVPALRDIFRDLYADEEARIYRRWRDWCEANRDPETGAEPSPDCDHPPPVPDRTVMRLIRQAQALHQAALRAHIWTGARRLQQRRELLDRDPESAYAGLVSPGNAILAGDLYAGYSLLLAE